MTLREFGKCVEYNIEHNIKHAILGLGAPGVGKSQIIRTIGKKYGFKVIDIRLAQMSEVEIGGLIYPNESRTKTVWLAPEILPDEKRDGKNTILLLDEITSCTKRVQVAAYQLILDRRIGQYQLPEGTFVVALGNREDDDGVYIQLAGPLADRFEIHYIEPDFEEWKEDYALKNGVHPYVINYLTFKPSALHNQKAEEGMVFATPRSWTRVSDILAFDSDVTNPVIRHKIIGNVGEIEGNQFVEYCKKHASIVTADDFISGRAEAPKAPEQLSILVASVANKAMFLDGVSVGSLTDEQKKKAEQIICAMFRFPQGEYTIVGMKRLLEINREVVKNIFMTTDNRYIQKFIASNGYALGLEDESAKSSSKWLAMWD